jgi:hypothetical protein
MSTRPFIPPFQVINQPVSGSSVVDSKVTIKPLISKITYSMNWTGTLSGAFSVQVSDDYSENVDGSVRNPGTWNTLPVSVTVSAAGSAGNGFYEIATGAYAIQLVYTPGMAPGAGAMSAIVTGQVM